MSDITEFPGSPNRPTTEDETDKLHAEAFRVLEGRISDCVIMAGIATQTVSELRSPKVALMRYTSRSSTRFKC
jgi:hypothetical protein